MNKSEFPKKKQFDWLPENTILNLLAQSSFGVLFINFVAQGMRGMDKKELSFRVGLELLIGVAIYQFFLGGYQIFYSVIYSVIAAHFLNWVFNGNIWVVVRYLRVYSRNPQSLEESVVKINRFLSNRTKLREAVYIGSYGDKIKINSSRSDVDLRLFFPRGIFPFFYINFLLLYLRVWSLIKIIPLDLYAYDDIKSLNRFSKSEGILVVKDNDNRISESFGVRAVAIHGE